MQIDILAVEAESEPDPARIQRVLDAARRYVAYRERAAAMASGRIPEARTLADAIDRDFLAFDIARAERELRAAVIALDPDAAPFWLSEPEARARHAEEE
ncbi:hypothetical protein [Paracraurococcus ruber]|uniref:Uncharacterized protein n=1 Tax=Paracraurococcus ruber TaxID=77675 RepID=A0ABS1CSE7_9PROT|nr:hypothetical protein [Paracraurococcus ruber]MBK1657294.1 hypothetical protein [Paracraurococcus ruber]TDG33439.1 hypothetical protein E2C05_03570 [Paracraurococcus ruber]